MQGMKRYHPLQGKNRGFWYIWRHYPPGALFYTSAKRQEFCENLCCSAHESSFFLPNLRSNRQLELPLTLNFSYRISRHSALAPTVSLVQYFAREMWAPWCTLVSVAKRQQFPWPPSIQTSSPKLENMVPGAWICGFSYCDQVYFLLRGRKSRGARTSTRFSKIGSLTPPFQTRATLRFLSRCPRWHLVPAGLAMAAYLWVEQRKSNGAHSTLTADAAGVMVRPWKAGPHTEQCMYKLRT